MPELQIIDWSIIALFFVIVIGIGVWASRSAGKSSSEFFLGGRGMPWWLLGVSMVACTFSADTPNLVAGMVRENGVSKNWAWWAFLVTGMVTVFIYAKLWRRSEVMTDLEFYELRYGGKAASFLRGFRSIYLGLFFNILIMATVTLAIIKYGQIMFGAEKWECVVYGSVGVVIYATFGGIKGCIWADFFQYGIAMFGAVYAGYVAIGEAGKSAAAKALEAGSITVDKVAEFASNYSISDLLTEPAIADKISIFPDMNDPSAWIPLLLMPLAVQWWAAWYPGAEPGGGGYIAQRMLSAKDEKNAIGATLFFNFAHYALRPWPWIIVALASLVCFPMDKKVASEGAKTTVAAIEFVQLKAEFDYAKANNTDKLVDLTTSFEKAQKDSATKTNEDATKMAIQAILGHKPASFLTVADKKRIEELGKEIPTAKDDKKKAELTQELADIKEVATLNEQSVATALKFAAKYSAFLALPEDPKTDTEELGPKALAKKALDAEVFEYVMIKKRTTSIAEGFNHITDSTVMAQDIGYPAMISKLGPGFLGIVIASIIAAYMSTIGTHLNWGSSYAVNDFYKRFVKKDATELEMVRMGRICTVVLMVIAGTLACFLTSATQAFNILLLSGAGSGAIYLLRWFWWRINAWSEIFAMIVTTIVAIILVVFVEDEAIKTEILDGYSMKFLIAVLATTIAWLVGTFATKPEDTATLRKFFRKCHPGGPGWAKVVAEARAEGDMIDEKIHGQAWEMPVQILCCFLGCVAIYCSLFSIGAFVYGDIARGAILGVIAIVSTIWLFKSFSKTVTE